MTEKNGFDQRRDAIIKLLSTALRKHGVIESPPDAISVFRLLPGVARELAMIWEAGKRSDADKLVITKVARIKKLASELLAARNSLVGAGASGDLMRALVNLAMADVYSEGSMPQKGRKKNLAALQVAEKFREFYPIITGHRAGKNSDHDFVQTLGEIFKILNFDAKPQHYAKRPAGSCGGSRVS